MKLPLKESLIAIFGTICIAVHFILLFFPVPDFWIQLPLYLTLFFGGIPLIYDLAKKMFKFEFGSDILAAISIITSILLGEYLAGSIVVLMLSSGVALEDYAVRTASSVLDALARRMPTIAHLKQNGKIIDIETAKISIGDTLEIFPHEICPVDGLVTDGHGIMDESYLTGEPFMISKAPGSTVLSGAINGDQSLTIKANKLAIDSRYAKVMEVMKAVEEKKTPIRRLGDELGAIYTPIAIGIALLAWLLSGEVIRFLAVLVVATPCPLLIAIPVAIIGSISSCARRGIIIKNPAVLEQMNLCQTMILDKTGTLTYGRPAISSSTYFNHFSPDTILTYAASVERYSKHPLAEALLKAAEMHKVELIEASQVSEKPGKGLSGIVDGHQIQITSKNKLILEGKQSIADKLPLGTGLECIILINGELAAHYRFHDEPKKDSRSFVNHLAPHHHFKKVMIVSGDRESEVRYLADQVGIKEIYASQSPEQKVELVAKENRLAKTVFIGDGINDAPALAMATVGVALGQNSDITAEAAGAVIMDSSLSKLDEFIHLSQRMRQIAQQSAIGGMALSMIGMGVAAFGFLPPVAGALSQELIDLLAILNALRTAYPPKKLADYE